MTALNSPKSSVFLVAGRFGAASSVDAPVRRPVRGAGAPVSSGREPGVTVEGERQRALSTFRQRGARRAAASVLPSSLGSAGRRQLATGRHKGRAG